MLYLPKEAINEILALISEQISKAAPALCSLLRCLLLTLESVSESPTRPLAVTRACLRWICPQHLSLQIYRLMRAGAASRLCAIIYLRPVTEYDKQEIKARPYADVQTHNRLDRTNVHTSDTHMGGLRCLNKKKKKSKPRSQKSLTCNCHYWC